jgi:hypothetical protein
MEQAPIDLSRLASVTASLQSWNNVLAVLRTASGAGVTWDLTNPLIMQISQQLQAQITPQGNVVSMAERDHPPAA